MNLMIDALPNLWIIMVCHWKNTKFNEYLDDFDDKVN